VSPEHVGWCKASAWALGEVLAGLQRPMSRAAMVLDLDFMVDRRNMTGEPVPGVRLLSRRWGVGVKAARLAVEAWRRDSLVGRAEAEGHAQGHGEGHGEGHAQSSTMPMASTTTAQEGHGEGHAQGHTEGTPVAQEPLFMGIVAAPQTTDIQTSDKNTKTRAKRAGWSDEQVQQVLDEMHAIELRHSPNANRPSFAVQAERVRAAAYSLKDLCKETGRPARELIIHAWEWWWSNPNPFCRETYRGAEGYKTCLRPANCKGYASSGLTLQASKYVPTAEEALDAVLEVGCSGAEARYPAAARTIRQTFDFSMGGDLARMRAPKDAAKMRAAWASGFTRYLSPPPALALVSR